MRRKRGGLPRILGYDPFTELRRETKSQSASRQDRCPPEQTDEPTDTSKQAEQAKDDGVRYEPRLVEHHGQLHDLDQSHGEWESQSEWVAKLDDLVDTELAKDGTYKPVETETPREEFL